MWKQAATAPRNGQPVYFYDRVHRAMVIGVYIEDGWKLWPKMRDGWLPLHLTRFSDWTSLPPPPPDEQATMNAPR